RRVGILIHQKDAISVVDVGRVSVTLEQHVEGGARFVNAPRRHEKPCAPGGQHLLALVGRNLQRQKRQAQQRQTERLDHLGAAVADGNEFAENVVSDFKLLEANV